MTISSKAEAIAKLVEIGNHDLPHATLAIELLSRFYYTDVSWTSREDYWNMIHHTIRQRGIYSLNGLQGWIDRNGKLWTNDYSAHSIAAGMLNGMDTEMLENAGWIHVSCNSFPIRDHNCSRTRRTSDRQRRKLRDMGIEIDASYEMSKPPVKDTEMIVLDLDGFSVNGVRKFSLKETLEREEREAREVELATSVPAAIVSDNRLSQAIEAVGMF